MHKSKMRRCKTSQHCRKGKLTMQTRTQIRAENNNIIITICDAPEEYPVGRLKINFKNSEAVTCY